jgi:hypothetical protein
MEKQSLCETLVNSCSSEVPFLVTDGCAMVAIQQRFVTISVAISVTLRRVCFLLLLLLLLIASLAAAFTASPSAAPVVAHCCSDGYYSYLLHRLMNMLYIMLLFIANE